MRIAVIQLIRRQLILHREIVGFGCSLIITGLVMFQPIKALRAMEYGATMPLKSSIGRRRGRTIPTFISASSRDSSRVNQLKFHLTPIVQFKHSYSTTKLYWSPDDQFQDKNPLPQPRQHQTKQTAPNNRFNDSKQSTQKISILQHENRSYRSAEEIQSHILKATNTNDFFASNEDFPTFQSIGIQSSVLLERIQRILEVTTSQRDDERKIVTRPSAVQAASFLALKSGVDIKIGAETGSGKTMAYLLPIIDDILQRKKTATPVQFPSLGYEYARAIILVPNKELANQVARMATQLCGPRSLIWGSRGEIFNRDESSSIVNETDVVRLGILPGGLKNPDDYRPFRMGLTDPKNHPPLDIVITTPASLGPMALSPKNINLFADVQTLVIDEADMLFDGGYLRQLENVLMGFRRADRLDSSFGVTKTQHVLVAATLPDMGLKSVDAYIQKKFPYTIGITMNGMHNARHYGLKEKTTWIQDNHDETQINKRRLERLVDMLQRNNVNDNDVENSVGVALAGEKVIVFLNSVDDVDGVTNALRRSQIDAVPYHAKISLTERTENLDRFRKYVADSSSNERVRIGISKKQTDSSAVPVLVCTDLAARGLDIPGVTAVVQLQFAGNVVTHLHRMGRCGRAGNRDGRGVIFYGGKEKALVEVVKACESQQDRMVLKGNDIAFDEEDSAGKVQNAFSRKRGFTKKQKKLKKKMPLDN